MWHFCQEFENFTTEINNQLDEKDDKIFDLQKEVEQLKSDLLNAVRNSKNGGKQIILDQ